LKTNLKNGRKRAKFLSDNSTLMIIKENIYHFI